jgi:hypothetical protein
MTQDDIPAGPTVPLGCAAPRLVHCFSSAIISKLPSLTPRVGLILSLVLVLAVQYARSPWRKVPPGPRGLPILGNTLQLQNKAWLVGHDCKRKLGAPSFISVNNMNLEIDKRYPREYNVLECPWPTHSHLRQSQACF